MQERVEEDTLRDELVSYSASFIDMNFLSLTIKECVVCVWHSQAIPLGSHSLSIETGHGLFEKALKPECAPPLPNTGGFPQEVRQTRLQYTRMQPSQAQGNGSYKIK